MAIVIDAQQLVRNKTGLPTEAFFVDTNVLLDINDPFGLSLSDVMLAQRNEILSDIVHRLKSADGVRSFSTLSVALEYYKHIQVGFYQTQVNKAPGAREALKFSTMEFKRLRDSDAQFMLGWELQLKLFKKTFSKNYQIYDASPQVSDVLSTFQGSKVDFGDHLLFKTVMQSKPELRCVFSNDGDFYSFPDELHVLTTNKNMIALAKREGRLFS